ncbi:MAG: cell surface protein SprA [Candidatus Eisenbacteria bacterium]|nr:cell surface protein SprA [Candidatus Eisenbacteria bacterium]
MVSVRVKAGRTMGTTCGETPVNRWQRQQTRYTTTNRKSTRPMSPAGAPAGSSEPTGPEERRVPTTSRRSNPLSACAVLCVTVLAVACWALPALSQGSGEAVPDSVFPNAATPDSTTAGASDSTAAPPDTTAAVLPGGAVTAQPDTAAVLPDSSSAASPDTAATAVTDSSASISLDRSGAEQSLESAPQDSAPGVAPADTLAREQLPGAQAADSTAAAAPDTARPPVERPSYELGVGRLLERPAEFLRPWDLSRTGTGVGLRPRRVSFPDALPSSAPVDRRVLLKRDLSYTVLELKPSGFPGYVMYAAPRDEFQKLAGDMAVRRTWRNTVLTGLQRAQTDAPGGLLDIDIPMPLPGPFVRAIGPGANLKVRGSERITFGGQTSYVVEALEQESGRPSRFPQLDMEQQLTVNLEGTIGRKIHVYVDHRSGGDAFGTGKTNQIRVHYDGDEDEIIQKIELGEVNLSIPGTEFVSYSGRHEGLFGAKMTAKMGKFDLIAIASKEEGESSGASFTGTSESDSLVIDDIRYMSDSFFAVDEEALKYSNVYLEEISVYVDDRNGANDIETGAEPGVAYLEDPTTPASPPDGPRQRGMFDELIELEDYLVDYQSGIIEFERSLQTGRVLAVSYRLNGGVAVGGSDGDSLRLKMIRSDERVTGTEWEPIRLHELKNVYDLGAEDIPEEGFELTIRKRTPSGEILDTQDGTPYIEILGLDTAGVGGVGDPDGIVDLEWIDFEKGYLIFPHFTPFCPEFDTTGFYYPEGEPDDIYTADELEEKNCLVYSEENFDAGDDIYFIEVGYNRPRTTFYLGNINIIENSEVVRLNGVRLTSGVDYTIYYPAGQLTLLSDEAKEPDARVTVEYDYKPFGLTGESTLLGTRGVYNWSENVVLGSTWMYQSKGTPEDRPRLGEEPSRTVVGDVNVNAQFQPRIMTTLADMVPFVDTDAESHLKIAAEAAVCLPNPNTKGFVSIDDMEGTEDIYMLGVSRKTWTPSSLPATGDVLAVDRMSIDWYNPDRKVREGDLFPDLPDEEANDIRTVLEIDHESSGLGSWAGLMRLLSKTGDDYSESEFIEVWVNDNGSRQGLIHVDLGTLNEDYYPLFEEPNGELDTEDVDRNGFDADEDTGLDTVFGDDEDWSPGDADDGYDDYDFEYGSDDYSRINGSEGNERLDTEDLNGNFYLDTDNKYWQLTVDLSDTSTYLVQDNSVAPVPADKRTNWRLYRIPLEDALSVNGMNDWTVIKSARIWFENLPVGGEPIMLGGVDIVGNNWLAGPIRDEDGEIVPEAELGDMAFRITSKNTKEDLDYVPPFDPGVDEETNLPKREGSLVLLYSDIEGGHTASATQNFFSEENYTGYQSLEFYVHGESVTEGGEEDVDDGTEFFLRIGADSLNYYEYSLELRPGWYQDSGSTATKLSIPFTSFTNLKLDAYAEQDTAWAWGDTSRIQRERFTRVGAPSLSRVSQLTIGLRNANEGPLADEISGEIWLDDIQLGEVWKEIGWAERATIDARFADLATFNFDLRHVDGNFHSLKQERGSGQDNLSYNMTSTVNADRFVTGLGVSLPVNIQWKRQVTEPRFSTGSDVVLSEEQSNDERTIVKDRSISASLSRRRQSPGFWTHLLLDGLSLSASAADHVRTSPTRNDTSTTLRARASYRYSPERTGIRLFRDTELFLKPSSVRFTASTHLIHTLAYDVDVEGVQSKRTDNYDKKLDASGNIDFQFLENLRTSHGVTVKRDLAQENRPVSGINIGVETQRQYNNSLSFSPRFGSWFSPEYSFSSSFTDNHGPEARGANDPPDARDIRGTTSQEIRTSLDLKRLFGGSGSSGRSRPRRPRRGEEDNDEQEGEDDGDGDEDEGGASIGDLVSPVLYVFRNMDAIDARYSMRWSSRFDGIRSADMPGWDYRLGLAKGEGADDRTEETTLTLDSGIKLTRDVRIKGSYRRTVDGRWYKNTVSDTVDLFTQTESMTESTKGSLSWSGFEKVGPLKSIFKSARARSGVEYKRNYSGPVGEPSTEGNALVLNPIISVDMTFQNGLSGSFTWDRRRSTNYSLSGTGSVTREISGSTSLTLNYRFSAPQGLKLPFFGQKLRFQSNLDCSLTLRTGSKLTKTASDEASLDQVDPTADTSDFSITGDATYSFSRSVSGGLQVSFAQNRDEKRDQTRRTIGVHLTAEFKF